MLLCLRKVMKICNTFLTHNKMSSTYDKNNSNTNPNELLLSSSSSAGAAVATTTTNNTDNNPLTKSDKPLNEEQCNDKDLESYQEDGLDADFYEEDDQLPSLTEEQRLERIQHYRNQVENRDYCPHSLLEVYKGVVVANTEKLKEDMQKSSTE